ncbi:MAG: hypothetical protein ABSD75_33605 [Terriglobales bacterium]
MGTRCKGQIVGTAAIHWTRRYSFPSVMKSFHKQSLQNVMVG